MRTPAIDPRPPEYATNHLKMYLCGSAMRFQGCIVMAMIAVIRAPVLKLIRRGRALEKSFAGETTLAEMFMARGAIATVSMEMHTTNLLSNMPINEIGSHNY